MESVSYVQINRKVSELASMSLEDIAEEYLVREAEFEKVLDHLLDVIGQHTENHDEAVAILDEAAGIINQWG